MQDDELVTLTEAARIAQLSRGAITAWIRRGRLPVYEGERTRQAEWRRSRTTPKYKTKQLVKRSDVIAASFESKKKRLLEQHADLNLMTTKELANRFGYDYDWVHHLTKKFELTRYYIDNCVYMISGQELWEKSQDHPYYAQIFLKL